VKAVIQAGDRGKPSSVTLALPTTGSMDVEKASERRGSKEPQPQEENRVKKERASVRPQEPMGSVKA
jgi:hypothetical protein